MFIYALLIAICAAALHGKIGAVSEETAIICIVVGLLSALTAIIVAPWQFHLLIFLGVIVFRFNPANRVFSMSNLSSFPSPSRLNASIFKRTR
ncbi:MAG: hypothetical protein AAGD25_12565 [Cyanobacteria bacterium P01_F01_bin.150]